jgi:hypothetical protein
MFSSAKLKGKAGVLGFELLYLDRKDIYIAGGGIGGVDMEQLQ